MSITLTLSAMLPALAAACEGGGGTTPKLSISASPTSVTLPNPKSTITITDNSLTENAVIKSVEAEEKENAFQWSFSVTSCNGKELKPLGTCTIPVTYIGELKSKVTFVALDENGLSSGTATVTATPPIQAEPTELPYGGVKVGAESKKTLKVKTNEKIAIKTVSSTGTAFKIASDTCSGKTHEAKEECTVEVAFKPTEKIKYANTLNIPYEIVSNKFTSKREVAMTGEGS
jgi:hypothetical protein